MIHKTYELKSNRMYLEKYENLSENFNPQVLHSPCTYNYPHPSGPCTPYATDQCITQTSDLTHPVISLMTHTGDDID